jgi:hypothetical protein
MFHMYEVKHSQALASCWTISKHLECSTFCMHDNQFTPHIDIQIQNTFNDVFMDWHALFKCKCKFKLANKHGHRQWDQHQQSTQQQATNIIDCHWANLRKTGTQQKTVSWSPTIHPSRCAGGCWFTWPHFQTNYFLHQKIGHRQAICPIRLCNGQAQILVQSLDIKLAN